MDYLEELRAAYEPVRDQLEAAVAAGHEDPLRLASPLREAAVTARWWVEQAARPRRRADARVMPAPAAQMWRVAADMDGEPPISAADLSKVEPALAFMILIRLQALGRTRVSTSWDPGFEIGWALALADVRYHGFAFPVQSSVDVSPGDVIAYRSGAKPEVLLKDGVPPPATRPSPPAVAG